MTVKLTRGNGKGQWESYRSSDTAPMTVFYRCRFCGSTDSLAGHTIGAQGLTTSSVLCPQPGCRMEVRLLLEGWLYDRVEHPMAYSLCQADGDGH